MLRLGQRRSLKGPYKVTDKAYQVLHALGASLTQVANMPDSSNDLADDIWNALVNSFVVIAECTNRNPNVFYELGIAHTLGKPAILITQLKEDVPSDLRSFRYIEYSPSRSGLAKLESALGKTLKEVSENYWPA